MSLIVQIQEIVSGPIKDLYLELTTGPLFTFQTPPPVHIQLVPDTVGDLNLGSSIGDQNLGSSIAPNLGSSFTNGDQNLGSSNLSLPSLPNLPIPGSS
ncbi:MAG TPA: hypothetical protein H9870_11075 [Candidatus Corynebacterium avicola]|uniref:Uncharacterized protein n=1 Tax=Candidatus Corynebacterium avicola TaxID=2838527 RepID=A0A9D1UMT9_9CORY|nr:hypothetical protein [Candidatus Corynebacterium avicola]